MLSGSNYKVQVDGLDLYYGRIHCLKSIGLSVEGRSITAFIGPSGCGKTSLLRCINRMNDRIADCVIKGSVKVDGEEVYSKGCDVILLRRKVGMVFQRPTPFPKSIFENVAFAPRIHGICGSRSELRDLVEESLLKSGLWNEVKDRLKESPFSLSGGQQQRLCIARAIAVRPNVILMDEPCSALDPIATRVVEELIISLKEDYTIIIVTHSMQQAARISDGTAFFYDGRLVELARTKDIFTNPKDPLTNSYITGRVG